MIIYTLAGNKIGTLEDIKAGRIRDLWSADLKDANLTGADLEGADLRKADLRGVNLSGAYLGGADLYGADLKRAYLRRADLRRVNFRGANLQDTEIKSFQLGGHFAWLHTGEQYEGGSYLKIGCIGASMEWWQGNYEEAGEMEHYSSDKIQAYGKLISVFKDLYGRK